MKEDILHDVGEPPEAPSESDCCNSGCTPCVYDIYESQLLKWRNNDMVRHKSREIRCDLLSETKFKPFTLLHKTNLTYNTCMLRFQPNINGNGSLLNSVEQNIPGVLPYNVGQHFVMKTDDDYSRQCSTRNETRKVVSNSVVVTEAKPELSTRDRALDFNERSFTTRAYTPITISVEESNCCFNIIVKLYKEGEMSRYIESLTVGKVIYFRGPYGDFKYNSNSYKQVLMVCMGTGIAPIYTVVQHILSNEDDDTLVKLLYSCRNAEDILLRNELKSFTSYWNFTLKYFITGDVSNNIIQKFGENFVFRRINEKEISREITSCKSVYDSLVLICGNNEFSNTVLNVCIQYGVSQENIHVF